MEKLTWNSIEEFLTQNEYEFIHVDSEEEYQDEVEKIQHENESVIGVLNGVATEKFRCKKWRPVKKRICRLVNGKYECVTHTRYICVER